MSWWEKASKSAKEQFKAVGSAAREFANEVNLNRQTNNKNKMQHTQ